jgi:uncharacterized protein YkwD
MQVSVHIRIVFCIFGLTLGLASAAQAASLTAKEQSVMGVVNDVRAAHDLRPLQVDAKLVRAARQHSRTLIRTDVFTHGAMGTRLVRSGARGPLFGENLAWALGRRATARAIVRSWLASPAHRANLLRPGWRRIGIGSRVGTFRGYRRVTMITADFAGS